MAKLEMVAEKWSGIREKLAARVNTTGTVYDKIKSIIGVIVMVLFHLRKVFMAIPVIYYALKIAGYNRTHLPEIVGINLQSNGVFLQTISREMAVTGPLALTGACLVLMLFSRKAIYPWAVSIFSLALPILLLVSNLYPA